MKLVKLSVKRFQCIEAAELEFGPGLNVLYGPNDLGKSSLAWAIRAVLLLQHTSSQHEKFVSWYGGGEPRVELTLTDDDGRYWRVSKTFGAGAAGRSSLETSKDGRTFNPDVSGRQVDEKLRKLLGWGLAGVGGQGGAKGLPDSFLAQVLLAEQDDVRSVLFDTSLTDDPDESGRLRLTQALGALAQDPLFKDVLDDAQAFVDKAFTPTGRKKKSAGSPFIELGDQIKELRNERAELEAKLRETGAAETKIRELIDRRDAMERELARGRSDLTETRQRFDLGMQQAALRAQLEAHLDTLRGVTALEVRIADAGRERDELGTQIVAGAAMVRDATAELQQRETERDLAAAQRDALDADATAEHERGELQRQASEAEAAVIEHARTVERATAALHRATELADQVQKGVDAVRTTAAAVQVAEAGLVTAEGDARRRAEAVEHARQELRDATSGDRAQALALRRTELANRRLTRVGERAPLETMLRELAELASLESKVATAEAERGRLAAEVRTTQSAIGAVETRLAELEGTRAATVAVERYGHLARARATLAAADETRITTERERARADRLRLEETALRATVSASLPSNAAIAELRRLREELRIADARLGGGLSIIVRPKRAIEVRATRDGTVDPSRTTSDPISLSASRVVAVSIDGLVDLEITAGEEAARARAAELRARWAAESRAVLRTQGVETVEDLESRRLVADATLKQADELLRQREHAERAAGEPTAFDVGAVATQVAELEAELATFDAAALAGTLGKLGATWQQALKGTLTTLDQQRAAGLATLESTRTQLTRTETQLDAATEVGANLRAEVTRHSNGRTEPVDVAQKPCVTALAEIDRDVAEIDRQLVALTGNASDEEQVARKRVADAERAATLAATQRTERQTAGNAARDAAIQATTRLETTRNQAADHDPRGIWTVALADGTPLDVTAFRAAVTDAEQHHVAVRIRATQAAEHLRAKALERTTLLQTAREASHAADKLARTARTMLDTIAESHHECETSFAAIQVSLAQMQTERASANPDAARSAIEVLQPQVAAMGAGAVVDAATVTALEASVTQFERGVRELEEEVARARGALEQVGGAIVRERQLELDEAIRQKERLEHQIEIEYDAWKLLVETLRESESTQGAHLGRALAAPISKRFHELTGGRYGDFELGAHLAAEGLQAAGESRAISALSAGTQDQLATLLRLCIAEQIHSSIVLDDHLSQSDPDKVGWFNKILRGAGSQIQIILITCRPAEVLGVHELATAESSVRRSAAGLVTSVDLGRVIQRYAPR